MKGHHFFHILIIAALLAGCKKLDVEPTEGTPVFSAKFELNGSPKHWQAGVDGYYMFSGFEKGSDGVYVFTANLAREGCNTDCGESLNIHIRDFEQLFQGVPDVGTALRPGDYFYFRPFSDSMIWVLDTTVFYRTHFDASASFVTSGAAQYTWNFGGQGTGTGIVPVFDFDQLDQPVPVTLTTISSNAGSSSSQTRFVQKQASGPACAVQIFVDQDSVNVGFLNTVVVGQAPFSFLWQNGSTTSGVSFPTNQNVQTSVTVTDADGCTSNAAIHFQPNPGTVPLYCSAAFNYMVEEVTKVDSVLNHIPGDSLQFSAITVVYTDAAGKPFRSDLGVQPAPSFFTILSSEMYETNEKGERTRKLAIRFACRLWDAQGNMIEIQNGEAVIAVAYP